MASSGLVVAVVVLVGAVVEVACVDVVEVVEVVDTAVELAVVAAAGRVEVDVAAEVAALVDTTEPPGPLEQHASGRASTTARSRLALTVP